MSVTPPGQPPGNGPKPPARSDATPPPKAAEPAAPSAHLPTVVPAGGDDFDWQATLVAPASAPEGQNVSLTQWEGPMRAWLRAAAHGPIGDTLERLSGVPKAFIGEHPDHFGFVQAKQAYAALQRPELVAPGFQIAEPETPSPPGLREAEAAVERSSRRRHTVNPAQVALPLVVDFHRYFWRRGQFGHGPLSVAQAKAIVARSSRIVEIGGGNGFNAELLRAVGGERVSVVSVRSFDRFPLGGGAPASGVLDYASAVPPQFMRAVETLGGPPNAPVRAIRRWVGANAERLIAAIAPQRDLQGARDWFCSLGPAVGAVPERGSPESLRDEGLRGWDLFMSYPPTLKKDGVDLVAESLSHLSAETQRVHLVPGAYLPAQQAEDLLRRMSKAGWRLEQVVPSFLIAVGGVDDLLTFVRKD